jgi:hypothetical protein
MWKHSSSTSVYSTYISVYPICQSFWFLSGFLGRVVLLARKLLNQGILVVKIFTSKALYGRHHDFVNSYEILCHKWPRICPVCRYYNSVMFSFITYHRFVNRITLGVPPMEQELLTFHCLSFCTFSFGHCTSIVCP